MTTMRGPSLTLSILVAVCLAPGRSQSQDAPAWREIRYRESSQAFPNPERGFYAPRMSNRIGRLDGLRERGITLLLVEVDLKAFKERDLTPEKLDEVRQAFAAVRQNGLKAIVRFAYGFTGRDYRSDPKDMDRILGHIRQLGKVFQENRDVLYGVQAGFLGPWGEWHGSNWGDPPSLEARRSVLFGLLDAVPAPITVHVRRPMFIRDIFAGEPGGAEITEATAYGGSRLSRVGWHDDALLSLPTDMGTYAQRGWDRERELRWCADHGRFTPFGGETVPSSARTPIAQVVRELELLHATYLNSSYHRGTLDGWRKAAYQGGTGFEHIERRLGYRLVADRLRIDEGGQFRRDTPRRAGPAQRRLRLAAHAEGGGPRAQPGGSDPPRRPHRHRPSPVDPGGRHRLAAGCHADTRRCPRRPMAAGPATRGPLAEPERRRPVRDPPRQRRDRLRRG